MNAMNPVNPTEENSNIKPTSNTTTKNSASGKKTNFFRDVRPPDLDSNFKNSSSSVSSSTLAPPWTPGRGRGKRMGRAPV